MTERFLSFIGDCFGTVASAGVKTHLGPSDVWRHLRAALPVCSDFPPEGQTQLSASPPLKAHYGSITCPGQQQQQQRPADPPPPPAQSGSLFLHHDWEGQGGHWKKTGWTVCLSGHLLCKAQRTTQVHAGHFHPSLILNDRTGVTWIRSWVSCSLKNL